MNQHENKASNETVVTQNSKKKFVEPTMELADIVLTENGFGGVNNGDFATYQS